MPNKDNKTEETIGCPHGRDSNQMCSHCIGINDDWKGGGADEVKDTSLEEIQKDLDNGKFYQICSNETTFKKYVFSKISEVRKATEQKVRGEMVEDVCGILRQIGTVENDEQMENVMLVIKSLLKS